MNRKQIETELKNHCIPLLREHGFKGSFPNLYKENDGFVFLINFQFYSSGGSLCINLGYADPNRQNVYYQKETEIKKLRVSQTTERIRLGAEKAGDDKWFSFGKTSYDEFRGKPIPARELVGIINDLIKTQALSWWATKNEEYRR